MLLIADALTVVYLRPALISSGFSEEDVKKIVVWYDPSQVATRNDRAADADSGFEKMAISYETWRRAHGFSNQDAPDAKEIAIRMMIEKGAISPELTQAMIAAIAPDVMQSVRDAQQADSVAPVPPEVQQILEQQGAPAPAPTPAAEPTPAPAEDEISGLIDKAVEGA
jgi:hypothetical protein